jgi:ANTAR domain
MSHSHSYRPAQHRSRREIDQAIGVLMGIRRCSAEQALVEITTVVRASGVGLGGVSRALLDLVCGDVDSTADETVARWDAVLRAPVRDGMSAGSS